MKKGDRVEYVGESWPFRVGYVGTITVVYDWPEDLGRDGYFAVVFDKEDGPVFCYGDSLKLVGTETKTE